MISLLRTTTINISRRAAGSIGSDGHTTEGAQSIFSNVAVDVQPIKGNEVLQLPEGDRKKENIWIFSSTQLLVDDMVTYKTIKYEVQTSEDWTDFKISYYRARATKVDDQNESL